MTRLHHPLATLLAPFAFALCGLSALAGDYYVVPAGTAGNTPTSPYDSWATAANSIADAVGAIPDNSGAVVHVAPGTYAVAAQISVSQSNVEIRSDDGSGRLARETTILDGGGRSTSDYDSLHRLFNVSGNNVTVRGLTLQNAISNGSGAGASVTGSAFTLADCTLTNLQGRVSSAPGGALYYSASSGKNHTISNCLVIRCSGNQYGGAIFANNTLGSYSTPGNYIYLVDSEFIGNHVEKVSGLDTNSGSQRGRVSAAPLYAVRCRFDDTGGSGGEVFADRTSYSIFTNCVFENLSSLLVRDGPSRAYDCTFNKNNCSYNFTLMERCIFSNEVDRAGSSCNFSGATVRNCLYTFNDFPVSAGSSLLENCTIVSNRAGGVLMGPGGGTAKFVNCVVFGNKFKNYGAPGNNPNFNYRSQWASGTGSSLILSNCYFEGCASVSVSSYKGKCVDPETGAVVNANGTKSLFSFDPSGATATISAAADADKALLFSDWPNGDWHLGGASALRDAGLKLGWMTSGTTDLDGQPRLVDAVGVPFSDSALPDLGCYETMLISGSITTMASPIEYASNGLPEYGYVDGIDAGSYLRTAPETVPVSDSERALCAGWKLYSLADGEETLARSSEDEGETATSCTITYAGGDWKLLWLWDTQYIVADADGEPVWRTYDTTPRESAPTISGLVCDTSLGNPIVVTGSVSGFADGCAVTVVTSSSPDFSNALSWTNAFAVLDEAGAFSITLQCGDPDSPYYLVPGTTYYVAVCADSEGGTAWTAPATVARATTAYVVPAGTAGNEPAAPYASWATAANTVADAVSALAGVADACVRIAPGTYDIASAVSIGTAGLEIRSDDGTGRLARETTILDGGFRSLEDYDRTTRIFQLASSAPAGVTIRGLTLQNAVGPSGTAVYIPANTKRFTLDSCTVSNCQARFTKNSASAGGLYFGNASGKGHLVTNCTFFGCSSGEYGGTLRIAESLASYGTRDKYLVVMDSQFINSSVNRTGDSTSYANSMFGGTVHGTIRAERCLFRNVWTGGGRGTIIMGGSYSVFEECVVENVQSGTFVNDCPTLFTNCVFRGNQCAFSFIGGMATVVSSVISNQLDFALNPYISAILSGGTMRNCLYTRCAQPFTVSGNALIENCTIVSNNNNGILMGPAGMQARFVNCVSFGNKYHNYGGPGGSPNFYYRSQWAGDASSLLVISNCYIEGATSYSVSGYKGKYVDPETGELVNGDGMVKSLLSFDPSGATATISAAADAAKNRLFVDWTQGDWHLPRKSPLRDAGLRRGWMTDTSADFDGNPRLTDRFGKPFAPDALPDLGCYECQIQSPYCTLILLQ